GQRQSNSASAAYTSWLLSPPALHRKDNASTAGKGTCDGNPLGKGSSIVGRDTPASGIISDPGIFAAYHDHPGRLDLTDQSQDILSWKSLADRPGLFPGDERDLLSAGNLPCVLH